MRIVPVHLWNHPPSAGTSAELVIRSNDAVLAKISEERKKQFRQSQHQTHLLLDRFALGSRVIIIEGTSGSGKDTFQTYLKNKLTHRLVYDYSEGEALSSWKHFQIDGIFKVRVKFMQLFVNYMSNIISRDENAVFLLNRFHLSTYAWTIIQDQKLGKDYDEVINALRLLPVHIFILHLDDNEIETRSQHPERSDAWRRFQQQIVKNYTFCDRMEIQLGS